MVRKNIKLLETNRICYTLPQKTIEKEYIIKKYEKYKEWIENEWEKEEKGFTEQLLTFFHRPLDFQLTIEISNYGPLGFYNENKNIATINLNTHLNPVNTIKHEMVHVMLEPFIKNYSIDHSRKEFIVNTILNTFLDEKK